MSACWYAWAKLGASVSSRQLRPVRSVEHDIGRGRLDAELAEHADDLVAVQRAVIHDVHYDVSGGKAGVTDPHCVPQYVVSKSERAMVAFGCT